MQVYHISYDCRKGICHLIHDNNSTSFFPAGPGFLIPGVAIIVSYSLIFYHLKSHGSSMKSQWKKFGHDDMEKKIAKREMQMTWTLVLVSFSYFLFVTPVVAFEFINVEDPHISNYKMVSECLHMLQHSMNTFIYVIKSEQYRKAYGLFLKEVIHELRSFIKTFFKS